MDSSLTTCPERKQRLSVSFVILFNQRILFLERPIHAFGYQVRDLTFKNIPVDPVGTLYVVSCPQLATTENVPCSVIQSAISSTQQFTPAIAILPQSQIGEHQDFPEVYFPETRDVHKLTFIIGNEENMFDATQINAFSRFTLVIDFFV